VQQIFLLYLEHRSALRVAEILKEQGHRMKAYFSRSGKPLGGVEFHKGHIHNLLNNVVYIGKVSYHDQLYQGLHEPVITEEVFQRVQALFAENRKRPLAAKQVTQAGLLSQLLYCKPCHSVMINTYSYDSKDKKKRYKYYVCTSAQKRGYKTCPTRSINADAIDRSVVDCLRQLGQNTELQQQQIEALKSQIQEELARLKEEQQRATGTIQQLTSQINVVREQKRMGVAGGPRLEPLTEQLQDAERRSTELRVKQMELEEQLFNQTELKDALLVTLPIWDTLFIQEKRRILRFLLKDIEYDGRDGKLGITFSPKGIRLLSAKVSTNKAEVTDDRATR
jgi:site-specific DNA recombinase